MNSVLGWIFQGILLALLQVRYPAAAVTETEMVYGRDPSYPIYERYRYAYDTYGYLFLSENADDAARARRRKRSPPRTRRMARRKKRGRLFCQRS